MAKRVRQRISYVLEDSISSAGGHRLGVNGLAVDTDNGILYSGGRDGVVCAWDLHLDAATSAQASSTSPSKPPSPRQGTKLRAQIQAHMHWINDVTLVRNNSALVSASSDLTVKLWRPQSEEHGVRPQTIGEHVDYVKCVATPPRHLNSDWVASGGLDRRICLWDLNGAGMKLEVDVRGEEKPEKGSVYSLAVGRDILACGGPEKTVRLYDPRTGLKISKLVGHLDNIRAILIAEAGDVILSAGSDKTIKMWSVRGGRCMYTFTMHDESVWSLFSDDPRLGIFYSADRSGLIAKTDVRGSLEDVDNGLSFALAQEHISVCKVVAAAGHVWTATTRSSINRWADFDTGRDLDATSRAARMQRRVSAARPPSFSISGASALPNPELPPPESIVRLSETAVFPIRSIPVVDLGSSPSEPPPRRGSVAPAQPPETEAKPVRQYPEETIEGQSGLHKHKMLNDRRRVLTLDTAGDVVLWDLILGKPVQNFGKKDLEEVEKLVNTREAVAPWCSVDLSAGNLTVVLEPFNCFDAEIYADELKTDTPIEFREDQRINLGRWILRYLFAGLIDEEIKRDESYRRKLNQEVETRLQLSGRESAGTSASVAHASNPSEDELGQAKTPRAKGSLTPLPTFSSLSIDFATPAPAMTIQGVSEHTPASTSAKGGAGGSGTKDDSLIAVEGATKPGLASTTSASEISEPKTSTDSGADKTRERGAESAKSPGTPFGKKFRMSFSSKRLGRSPSQSQPAQERLVVAEEKADESESSSTLEKEVDDSFLGVIQKMRNEYDKQLAQSPDRPVETLIRPSLGAETPVLKLPAGTMVIIQQETSGGDANIYQGTVNTVGLDADLIEQKAAMWLGEVLLQNQIPHREPVKISFMLQPLDGLPHVTSPDGSNRLNANRMLRVKKILAYIAERIEDLTEEEEAEGTKPESATGKLMPEDYLELYCNDKLLSPLMSLAAIRTHIWKGGNDVVMSYRCNGRRTIGPPRQQSKKVEETDGSKEEASATDSPEPGGETVPTT